MSGTAALFVSNRSRPAPNVLGVFTNPAGDYETLSTLSTMPAGGSVSRAGQAMVYDSTGKLTYAPNNLLLNTATLSTQSVTTAAINYILSFKGTGSVALSGAYSGSLAGTGASNRVYLAFTSTAASLTLTVTGTVTEAQLEAVTYQTTPSTYVATTSAAYYGPRFDVDPATLQPKGLLLEGARTNRCPYSQTFSNAAWLVTGGASKTSTSANGPDGTTTAATVSISGSNSYMYINPSASMTGVSGSVTASAFIRGTGTVFLGMYDAGAATVVGQIVTLSGNWQRFSATRTTTNSANISQLIIGAVTGNTVTSTSFDVSCVQLEEAAFASSYIPVPATGSTTRAAETFSITGYASNLIEAYYTDEQTGLASSANYNAGTAPSPSYAWLTSLRAYTNAYAGDIAAPAWLDNSGTTGNRMVTDSTGALTWAPANMVANSQAINNWTLIGSTVSSDATTAPDGTLTADKVVETATTGEHLAYTGLTAEDGAGYVFSIYAKAAERSWLYLRNTETTGKGVWFNLSNGTIGTSDPGRIGTIQSVGNGWYRCSVYAAGIAGFWVVAINVASADNTYSYSGTAGNGIYVWGAQLERVTYQTAPRAYIPTTSAAVYQPRFDYDGSTVPASPRGLLIEESRVNLLTYSQSISNAAWSKLQSTATASATICPDGTASAFLFAENTAANFHQLYNSVTVTASNTYTYSVYLKAAGRSIVRFANDTGPALSTFDLSTGTVVSGSTATIQSVGNGWYRCSHKFTPTTTSGVTYMQLGTNSSTFNYTGDGVSGILVFGAQTELGSFSTSYVPTTTASVTRVADVVKLTGSFFSSQWNVSQGTVLIQIGAISNTSYPTLFDVNNTNNAGANRMYLQGSANGTPLNFGVTSNAVTQFTLSTQTLSLTRTRAGVAYKLNDYAYATNGANVTKNTSASVPTVNNMTLGVAFNGGSIGGYVESFAYYNQRLPDAVLQQKSTPGAGY